VTKHSRNGKATQPKLEKRRIKDLIAFPMQAQTFPPLPAHEDEALAESIRKHGLREPIHILPRNTAGFSVNTKLAGHRRAAALESIGARVVPVLVRYDLACADRMTIIKQFIGSNDERRQLSVVGRIRSRTELFLAEKEQTLHTIDQGELLRLKDFLASTTKMSHKNIGRYLRILRCPMEVQDAVDRGLLGIELAAKVADLPDAVQKTISSKLRKGADPKQVVKSHLLDAANPQQQETAVSRCIRLLTQAGDALDGFDLVKYSGSLNPKNRAVITAITKICQDLVAADDRAQRRMVDLCKKTKRRSA